MKTQKLKTQSVQSPMLHESKRRRIKTRELAFKWKSPTEVLTLQRTLI